jgi:hypothetical protein
MAKTKGKTQIPEADKAASPAQESKEAAPPEKTFHEYPAAQGTIKDEQGTYHSARLWAPAQKDALREAGGLKGKFEIQNPETGAREKYDFEMKPKEHNGQKYLSGVVDREGKDPLVVRVVGIDGPHGRFAALRMAEMHRDGEQAQFQDIRGQGGIVRMNEAMTHKFTEKEGQLYETDRFRETLGVEPSALARLDHRDAVEAVMERQTAEDQERKEALEQGTGLEASDSGPDLDDEEDLGIGR